MQRTISISILSALAAGAALAGQASSRPGFEDTPYLPGQKWRVHDARRPHPHVIVPGAPSTQERAGRAPSDAIVLFDGKDLSHWMSSTAGKLSPPKWKLGDGFMEVASGTGHLVTKEKFGNAQIHVEWAAPVPPKGSDQLRGNSGVLIMSRYEIQVLDTYKNPTYADGYTAGIYGQFPPLVNPILPPGEWQTYDIVFEAPVFDKDKVVKPAYVTVFHNGVMVHHHQPILGSVAYRAVGTYAPHGPEEPLMLQDHDFPVRFRNIWVRRLAGYDQPEQQ
jgi:3-keto-disaccharide hydrolase